ncbi:MAG: POTRA domain-containing protein [Candidatus Poribacteria bacterium]
MKTINISTEYIFVFLIFAIILGVNAKSESISTSGGKPIDKSQTQYISKIVFGGNKALDRKNLAEIFNIRPKQLFDPMNVENGMDNILAEYKKRGYLFVKVEWDYEGDNQVTININIDEGERIRMGNIDLTGNLAFPKDQILGMFTIRKSDFFDEALFENDVERLLNFYSDNGYPMASISPSFDINEGRLNPKVQIDAGSIAKIGNIKLDGLKKTNENVILREIPIHTGDIFDQQKIDDAERLLNNMGYFGSISPISFSQADNNNVDVNLFVVESPTGRFNGIVGYNPSDNKNGKLAGTVEAGETNLFGTGRRISIKGSFGLADIYEFSYQEPWILGKPMNLGFMAQSTNRPDILTNQKYNEREIGLAVTGKMIEYVKGSVGLAYKKIRSSSINVDSGNSVQSESNTLSDTQLVNGRKYSVTFELQRDSRDYFINPTKGRTDKTGIELSRGEVKIIKFWIDLNQYFKVYRQQVIAFGIHAGRIWGNIIPLTELFYLGGANTLRGYAEEMFRGEGNIYSNLEYRFLASNSSHFFVFVDNGAIFSKSDGFSSQKVGYGFGMRIESMNGIISMDYGLAKGESILSGKIHVSLGAVF